LGLRGRESFGFFFFLGSGGLGAEEGGPQGLVFRWRLLFLLWPRVAGSGVMEGRGKAARGRKKIKREGGRLGFFGGEGSVMGP
jgi:hypothetical protein